MNPRDLERRSAAVTLSDMELFIFPELMYALVLANLMSPRIWRWRADPWFANIRRLKPLRRVQRVRQYIMDHYAFNLDLDTWGLTTRERELARFSGLIDADALAQSNALFGYEGDKYYFDIGIRTHFGLDKYDGNVIPYWKTETVEAMDAFVHRPGYTTGAGECVSLATLYAAALFIVAGIPLQDIFLLATPLHSQNFVDLDDGLLVNNRRLLTKTMWFNGTALSGQARRALENERVTFVAHPTGFIHTLYDRATIDPLAYERLASRLQAFLQTGLTPEILGNFLRQCAGCQKCFVLRHTINGVDRYIGIDSLFAYEQNSTFKVTDDTRTKLLAEIPVEEFALSHCPGKLVLNDIEGFVAGKVIDLNSPADVAELKRRCGCGCLDAEQAIDRLLRFCRVEPRLPDADGVMFDLAETPIEIEPGMEREAIMAHVAAIADGNVSAELAFHALRDLGRVESLPFLTAALQRNPVAVAGAASLTDEELQRWVVELPNVSIYDEPGRLAQPDEVWNFRRGDGLERALLLALVLRERRLDPAFTVVLDGGQASLRHAGRTLITLPSGKQPRERVWDLAAIALRS
jgi:hypothetical protein